MSVGAEEACRALGFHFRPKIAMDFDKPALTTYNNNFPSARTVHYPIESIIDGGLGGQRTSSEEDFLRSMGRIDLVLAGPPCQGHSNLNNHTRRLDPKNLLMLRVVRFVELVQPKYVIVENVPQARLDRHGTPKVAISELKKMGYSVASGVVDMSTIGVPQRRKRFVIIAAKGHWVPEISTLISPHQAYGRDLEWAIGDLEKTPREGILNSAANASMDNLRRMDFLFDNDLFDLPDALRPDCHRLKTHSYGAVYGRLRWNEPAPTITTGYGSMGQGRYVHPSRRSTITPREAARLQFFPDFFNFSGMTRTSLAKMIGNAVPPRLVFALVLGLMR
jgi:DNA (cytosine-5)-methyltransferase 1